jgi:hypothetical protein
LILRLALLDPVLAGLKVTLTVQFELPAIFVPQVFVWLKSPALVPLNVRLVRLMAALLAFVIMTF